MVRLTFKKFIKEQQDDLSQTVEDPGEFLLRDIDPRTGQETPAYQRLVKTLGKAKADEEVAKAQAAELKGRSNFFQTATKLATPSEKLQTTFDPRAIDDPTKLLDQKNAVVASGGMGGKKAVAQRSGAVGQEHFLGLDPRTGRPIGAFYRFPSSYQDPNLVNVQKN